MGPPDGQLGAGATATVQAPMYQVDPLWPKPLPNNWVLGSVVGLSVDSRDHIWITHRGNVAPKEAGMVAGTNGMQQPGGSPPPQPGDKRPISSICCAVAPPILEFDMAGNLVSSWGGPGRRVSVADVDARHHRRRQRQRVADDEPGTPDVEVHAPGKIPAAGWA